MKLLHTADWHLGKKLDQFSRIDEQREAMAEICRVADAYNVDAVLVAGDVYDTFNPSAEAVALYYKTLNKLSNGGKRAVIVIAGNHDQPERIEASGPLARECGITLVGYPDTVVETCKMDFVEVTKSEAGFIELMLPECKFPLRVLVTPYASEQRLRTFLGLEDSEEALRQLLQKRWSELAEKYCDANGVNILMAHLYMMKKGTTPPEEPEDERPIAMLGGAQAIFSENLPTQIQYAALGHLHGFLQIDSNPCPVVYSSSPLAYSFGETNPQKYCVIVDIEPNQPAKIERVELTSGKRLYSMKFENIDKACDWLVKYPNALVTLTIETDDFISEADRKRLYDCHQGIVAIVPESKNILAPNQTANGIDLSRNMEELFTQFFEHRHNGLPPSAELMALFKEVQSVSNEEA